MVFSTNKSNKNIDAKWNPKKFKKTRAFYNLKGPVILIRGIFLLMVNTSWSDAVEMTSISKEVNRII